MRRWLAALFVLTLTDCVWDEAHDTLTCRADDAGQLSRDADFEFLNPTPIPFMLVDENGRPIRVEDDAEDVR